MSVEKGVVWIDRPESRHLPFRLGQHLVLDGRSLNHAIERDQAAMTARLQSKAWEPHIAPLDQGNVGSCTGNAGTHECAADPIWSTLTAEERAALNEQFAVKLYSDATRVDGYRGVYPPTDTGSSGLAVQKVLRKRGVIGSYRWSTTLRGLVTLLQRGPVAWGTPWHREMFNPDPSGFVVPSGPVDGGHEILIYAVDVRNPDSDLSGTVFTARNSWSAGWGAAGDFRIRFADMAQLRREGCDYKQGIPA